MKQQARSPQGWSCLFRRHQTCSTQIIWMPWLFNATTIIRTWFLFSRKTIWRNGMRQEGVQKGIRRRGRVCESNLGGRWSGRSGRRGRGRGRRRNFEGGWPGHGGRPRPARGGARRRWVGSSPAARSSPRSCTATSAPRPSPASTPDPPSLLLKRKWIPPPVVFSHHTGENEIERNHMAKENVKCRCGTTDEVSRVTTTPRKARRGELAREGEGIVDACLLCARKGDGSVFGSPRLL